MLFMDSFEVKSSDSAQFRLFMPASKASLEIKRWWTYLLVNHPEDAKYSRVQQFWPFFDKMEMDEPGNFKTH